MPKLAWGSICGFFLLSVFLSLYVFSTGRFDSFIDIPSLIIVFLPAFALSLFNYGSRTFGFAWAAVKAVFVRNEKPHPEYARIAGDCIVYCICGGIAGAFINVISGFSCVDGDNLIVVVRYSLLGVLYSILAAGFIFYPLVRRFKCVVS